MNKLTPLVGSHVSTAGGFHKAIERGESIGCTAIQIFTKSNRTWHGKKITQEETKQFKDAVKKSSIESIVAHTGYLINVGSKNQTTAKKSTASLLDEIERCAQLGIKYLVVHPGSHVGAGEEVCIQQIAQNLDSALEQSDGNVTILLETMAGQGTNIGYTFDQLKKIRTLCKHKKNIAYCLDTCHVCSAGYDITTKKGYEETIKTFDQILGLKRLKAIHVNDSQKPCGSRVDRHAPLGEGIIPFTTFKLIMNDKRLVDIPKILETPSDADMKLWAKEIKQLKSFVTTS